MTNSYSLALVSWSSLLRSQHSYYPSEEGAQRPDKERERCWGTYVQRSRVMRKHTVVLSYKEHYEGKKTKCKAPNGIATSPSLFSRTFHRLVLITYSMQKWKGRPGPFYYVPPLTPSIYLSRHCRPYCKWSGTGGGMGLGIIALSPSIIITLKLSV